MSAQTADTTPPLLTLPATVSVEAAGPTTTVAYSVSAADGVDGPLTPECLPASGSAFAVGSTNVRCTATDAAGNMAEGTFAVVVMDTTSPLVVVPASITVEATSPAGAIVTFTVSASDLASGALTPVCAPPSGSLFAVGTLTVACTATDGSGNVGTNSFTVTVTPSTPGRMAGEGRINTGGNKHRFEFTVRERASGADAGHLEYEVRTSSGGRDRSDEFRSQTITRVQFSDQPGTSPGRRGPQVDTVTFAGTGRWNGQGGFVFEATAVDTGEPNRGRDTFTLVIRNSSGLVVGSVSGTLEGGNIQSLPSK